jgi:hypothetical protein
VLNIIKVHYMYENRIMKPIKIVKSWGKRDQSALYACMEIHS